MAKQAGDIASRYNIRDQILTLKLVLVFTFVVIVSTEPLKSSEIESCHLRELELCVVGAVSILQNPNGIPTTEIEINRHCELIMESSDCFHSYADRCLTKLQDSLANFVFKDLFKLEKDFCTNGTELRQDYLKHASCLREVQKKYQKVCLKDFQVGFERIHKLDRGLRLSTACW